MDVVVPKTLDMFVVPASQNRRTKAQLVFVNPRAGFAIYEGPKAQLVRASAVLNNLLIIYKVVDVEPKGGWLLMLIPKD
jgi:hypothetical protein